MKNMNAYLPINYQHQLEIRCGWPSLISCDAKAESRIQKCRNIHGRLLFLAFKRPAHLRRVITLLHINALFHLNALLSPLIWALSCLCHLLHLKGIKLFLFSPPENSKEGDSPPSYWSLVARCGIEDQHWKDWVELTWSQLYYNYLAIATS